MITRNTRNTGITTALREAPAGATTRATAKTPRTHRSARATTGIASPTSTGAVGAASAADSSPHYFPCFDAVCIREEGGQVLFAKAAGPDGLRCDRAKTIAEALNHLRNPREEGAGQDEVIAVLRDACERVVETFDLWRAEQSLSPTEEALYTIVWDALRTAETAGAESAGRTDKTAQLAEPAPVTTRAVKGAKP